MPLVADNLPADTDVLCEQCGYRLNGLPDAGNCPECGTAVAESTSGSSRRPPAWEDAQAGSILRRWRLTISSALFTPSHFFRRLATRRQDPRSLSFATIHWLASSILLGLATVLHGEWSLRHYLLGRSWTTSTRLMVFLLATITAFGLFASLSKLASLFTFWEARYWGYRLPRAVVLRALHYHSVHFVPVSLVGLLATLGWRVGLWNGWFGPQHAEIYLYAISGLVVLAAGYVFAIYVVAMRRIMYANL